MASLKRALKILLKIIAVLILLQAVGIAVAIYSDKRSIQNSEALRSRITVGMDWTAVSAQIEADRDWHMILFRGKPGQCGFIHGGGGPHENIPGRYTLSAPKGGGRIENLRDSGAREQVKDCPEVAVAFHPKFSFTKVEFAIHFGSNGKVTSTTPARAWD